MSSEYKRVALKRFAPIEERETPEGRFWSKFTLPVVEKLLSPATHISFNPVAPHDYAVTTGTRVAVYDSKTNKEKRNLSKFKDVVHSGTYRGDGALLVAGTAKGAVHVVDVATKSSLRTFKGHRGPVHVAQFSPELTTVLSAGDDRSVRVWDMPSGEAVTAVEHAHDDYIRCAHTSAATPHVWATGSYDHTVKLWDARVLGGKKAASSSSGASASGKGRYASGDDDDEDEDDEDKAVDDGSDSDSDSDSEADDGRPDDSSSSGSDEDDGDGDDSGAADADMGDSGAGRSSSSSAARGASGVASTAARGCLMTVNHGEPVTQVLLLPGGGSMLTSGGNSVKLWDIVGGGRLVHSFSHHQKLITSLCLDGSGGRLLSGGLDGLVKVYELSSFGVTHTMHFDGPVLSLGVSPDNTRLVAGLADGSLVVKQRPAKVADIAREAKQARVLRGGSYRYFLRGQSTVAASDDVRVESGRRQRLQPYDVHMRSFEYRSALDAALASHDPIVIASMLEELVSRRGLATALAGRDDDGLEPLLSHLVRYTQDPRFTALLLDVTNVALNIYGPALGTLPTCDGLFLRLSSKLAAEARLSKDLLGLQGMLDLLMASSAASSGAASAAQSAAAGRGARGGHVTGQDASASGDLDL